MKILYVLRHAKSSWENSDLADFDRPLNDRGETAAPFIGEVMRESGFAPDLIVSSPAVRARDTAKLVKKGARLECDLTFDERIYEASPQMLKQVVGSVDNRFESVMIVGHNPGMEGFVRLLTGQSEAMPTAALAVIDLDLDQWNELTAESGTLRRIIRPKDEMKTFKKGN